MVPVSPSINLIILKTHTQKRLILNPISVSFLPTVIPFIRFLYVFLLSEISIPCFNHFKNLSVRWISPGMFICFKIGRFRSFYFHLSLVIFFFTIECIASQMFCVNDYIQRKRFSFSRVMWKKLRIWCVHSEKIVVRAVFSFTKFTINLSPLNSSLKLFLLISFSLTGDSLLDFLTSLTLAVGRYNTINLLTWHMMMAEIMRTLVTELIFKIFFFFSICFK